MPDYYVQISGHIRADDENEASVRFGELYDEIQALGLIIDGMDSDD